MGKGAYVRLMRLQTAGVTAVAPILGYLAAAEASGAALEPLVHDPRVVVPLAAFGLCAHIFGFVHNEIADRATDAKAAYRQPKPLVSGAVSVRAAAAVVVAAGALGALIALWMAPGGDFAIVALTVLSMGLAVLYNRAGKTVVGGDALLGASIAVFVLAGASAYGGVAGAAAPGAVAVAALGGLIVLFNNAFEGGYKDYASDKEAGKRTLVLALRARGEPAQTPDRAVLAASFPLHLAMFLVAVYAIYAPLATGVSLADEERIAGAFIVTVAMIVFYARALVEPSRKRMLALFARHEGAALLLLLLPFVFHLRTLTVAALFVAPLLVFILTNRALFGTSFSPDV